MVSSRIRPAWDFKASSTIWRILPAGVDYVVGEIRDGEKKTVSFFCVRLEDGRRCWEGNVIPEKWWAGIEAVHGNILFLHEYPVPSMPDHRKIFAIEIPTGKLLWTNEELAFSFGLDGKVYASKDLFERRAYYGLDAVTGTVGEEVPPEEIQSLLTLRRDGWGGHVEIPTVGEVVPDAAGGMLDPSAELIPGDSLRCGEVEIVTCYEKDQGPALQPSIREHLFVVDTTGGEVLFHDVVCDRLSGPVPGTFFRVGERILYIKNRSILRSLPLH